MTMKPTKVYLLLGGMQGPDGEFDSIGMEALIPMLEALPQVSVQKIDWNNYNEVTVDIASHERDSSPYNFVVIGYSGGGSRATYLRNVPIDLMILYDPSPASQTHPVGPNVKRAICYHNTAPLMWVPGIGELGGGILRLTPGNTVTKSISINIALQHMLVQNDMNLHNQTVGYVKELVDA